MNNEGLPISEEELDLISGGGESSVRIVQHRIVHGDTLLGLALLYNTAIESILEWNPTVRKDDALRAGGVLSIPDGR